jgi:hypothetical protein
VFTPEPMPEPVLLAPPGVMPPGVVVPMPGVVVPVAGVVVLVSFIVPEVVSGDFAGSLLPPQATTLPIASAVRSDAYENFMTAPEFARRTCSTLRGARGFRWFRAARRASRGRRAGTVGAAVHSTCPRKLAPLAS